MPISMLNNQVGSSYIEGQTLAMMRVSSKMALLPTLILVAAISLSSCVAKGSIQQSFALGERSIYYVKLLKSQDKFVG